MDDRRPDDKPAGSAAGDAPDPAPTEQFPPIPGAPPAPPMMTPAPPAAAPIPQAGWQQPPQQAPTGWQAPAPAAPPPAWQPPTQPAASTGWTGPQAAPQQQWMPAGAYPAGANVREGGATGLAKLGAVVLVVFGLMFGLVGVVFIVTAGAIRDVLGDQPTEYGALFVGLATVVGIVILVVMVIQILTGIFAWRGSGVARVLGVIYGVLLGLLFLAGLIGSRNAGSGDGTTNNMGAALLFAVGYLYVALVFIFAYRKKA